MSPMENHHAAAAFSILLEEGNNFLSEQPRKVRHHMPTPQGCSQAPQRAVVRCSQKAVSCSNNNLQLMCCLLLRLNCVSIVQVWNVMRELIIQVGPGYYG